jgi:hypothetical protein
MMKNFKIAIRNVLMAMGVIALIVLAAEIYKIASGEKRISDYKIGEHTRDLYIQNQIMDSVRFQCLDRETSEVLFSFTLIAGETIFFDSNIDKLGLSTRPSFPNRHRLQVFSNPENKLLVEKDGAEFPFLFSEFPSRKVSGDWTLILTDNDIIIFWGTYRARETDVEDEKFHVQPQDIDPDTP